METRETAYMRLAKWALTDDTGMSSKAIGARWLGTSTGYHYYAHPLDASDFGRCYRLLEAIPQIDIAIMQGAGEAWDKLVPTWPALTALYEAELPSGRHPQFRELLRAILAAPAPAAAPETGGES